MILSLTLRKIFLEGDILHAYLNTGIWATFDLQFHLSPEGWWWPSMTRLPVEEQTPKRSCI